jgi:hypothetical protein
VSHVDTQEIYARRVTCTSITTVPTARATAAVIVLGLALATTGCGDGATSHAAGALSADDLRHLVMTQSDLPAGYEPKFEKHSDSLQICATEGSADLAATLQRIGFRGCASAGFRKQTTAALKLGNTPGSKLTLFDTAGHAATALPVIRKALIGDFELTNTGNDTTTVGETSALAASGLGDESLPGVKIPVVTDIADDVAMYVHVWRRGNVVAYTVTSNILADFTEQSALSLAKTIDRRIAEG